MRILGLALIAAVTWEACTRIQDQVTLGVPALSLRYEAPAIYAYDARGVHGIPFAHDGKFRINSIGFRSPELVPERETILCLGASETFGIAETDGKEYPRQLERRLNEAHPGRYQVVNGALPGERIEDIEVTLARTLKTTRPKYAILYASPGSAIWTAEQWDHLHPTPTSKDPPVERWGRFRLLSRLTSKIRAALPEPIQAWSRKRAVVAAIAAAHEIPASHLPESNFRAFSDHLERTLAVLAAAHVRTIVVTHANRFGPDGAVRDAQLETFRAFYPRLTDDGLFDTQRRFNAVLRRAARTRHLPVVDAARQIAPGSANFSDFFHFTDRGSARMAQLLADAVREEDVATGG